MKDTIFTTLQDLNHFDNFFFNPSSIAFLFFIVGLVVFVGTLIVLDDFSTYDNCNLKISAFISCLIFFIFSINYILSSTKVEWTGKKINIEKIQINNLEDTEQFFFNQCFLGFKNASNTIWLDDFLDCFYTQKKLFNKFKIKLLENKSVYILNEEFKTFFEKNYKEQPVKFEIIKPEIKNENGKYISLPSLDLIGFYYRKNYDDFKGDNLLFSNWIDYNKPLIIYKVSIE